MPGCGAVCRSAGKTQFYREMADELLDFLGVGPQRTGTTWLYKTLRQHPSLYLPEVLKETKYFDRRFDRGQEWYARYFESSRDDQMCGEIAPTYFDVPEVPERVRRVAPSCDILISLRHPAERAFSLYLHHLRKGRVSRPFGEAVEQKPRILESGRYAAHIPRWRSAFGREQVHVLFLRDIKEHPQDVLDQICTWLEVDQMRLPSQADRKVNAASMPRFPRLARIASLITVSLHSAGLHRIVEFGKKLGLRSVFFAGGEDEMPSLSAEDRAFLIDEYEEDVDYVEDVTGRTLSHWRQ